MSYCRFNYKMDCEPTSDEIVRLVSPETGRRLRLARWANIYADWKAGKSFEQIGERFDRHPSTIRRLLKYSIRRALRKGEMEWPKDAAGRSICDIPHPMPWGVVNRGVIFLSKDALRGRKPGFGMNPEQEWCHARTRPMKRESERYCLVCGRKGPLHLPVESQTLAHVFGSKAK